MGKAKKILIIIGVVLLLASCSLSIYNTIQVKDIVVVDVLKVVSEFDMKKELDARVEVKLSKYNNVVDSLKGELAKANSAKEQKVLNQYIVGLQNEALESYEIANTNISEQIWKRLNPMIDEFGNLKGYRIVIGANGMGSVLYNKDATDVTKELIVFVNKKYKNAE